MKILKVIEKVVIFIATVFCLLAFLISGSADESQGVSGIVRISLAYSVLGCIFIVLLFALGIVLYFSKYNKVGLGLLLAANVVVFGLCIAEYSTGVEVKSISIVIGLVGSSLYFAGLMMYGIHYLIVKLTAAENCDPDMNSKIQLLLKWKDLEKQGIITEEEFLEKKAEILNKIK